MGTPTTVPRGQAWAPYCFSPSGGRCRRFCHEETVNPLLGSGLLTLGIRLLRQQTVTLSKPPLRRR